MGAQFPCPLKACLSYTKGSDAVTQGVMSVVLFDNEVACCGG